MGWASRVARWIGCAPGEDLGLGCLAERRGTNIECRFLTRLLPFGLIPMWRTFPVLLSPIIALTGYAPDSWQSATITTPVRVMAISTK